MAALPPQTTIDEPGDHPSRAFFQQLWQYLSDGNLNVPSSQTVWRVPQDYPTTQAALDAINAVVAFSHNSPLIIRVTGHITEASLRIYGSTSPHVTRIRIEGADGNRDNNSITYTDVSAGIATAGCTLSRRFLRGISIKVSQTSAVACTFGRGTVLSNEISAGFAIPRIQGIAVYGGSIVQFQNIVTDFGTNTVRFRATEHSSLYIGTLDSAGAQIGVYAHRQSQLAINYVGTGCQLKQLQIYGDSRVRFGTGNYGTYTPTVNSTVDLIQLDHGTFTGVNVQLALADPAAAIKLVRTSSWRMNGGVLTLGTGAANTALTVYGSGSRFDIYGTVLHGDSRVQCTNNSEIALTFGTGSDQTWNYVTGAGGLVVNGSTLLAGTPPA